MNLAVFIAFLGIAYFTYLSNVITNGVTDGTKPFHWIGISIFILAVSVSEVLISPVMMAAVSILAPIKYKTIFQAFYLAVIGAMGWVASEVGAISLNHPYQTFLYLSVVAFFSSVIYVLLLKKMIRVAQDGVKEAG